MKQYQVGDSLKLKDDYRGGARFRGLTGEVLVVDSHSTNQTYCVKFDFPNGKDECWVYTDGIEFPPSFKPGDRVKILDKGYRPGQYATVLAPKKGDTKGVRVLHDNANGEETWGYQADQLELLPQTPELTLENVYTVAPQKELREVINAHAPKWMNPEDKGLIVRGFCTCIFWDTQDNILNGYNKPEQLLKTFPNHTEVSIPQFLDLLKGLVNPKPTIQLNSQLEAVVDQCLQQVTVYYGNDSKDKDRVPNYLTFQQVRDLWKALKEKRHGFTEAVSVQIPSLLVRNGIIDHLASQGVPLSGGCAGKYENECADLSWTGDEIWICESNDPQITLEQFLAKCTAKPLPKIAGYKVTTTPEGNLQVGCQVIELERLEALVEALVEALNPK